MRESCFYLCMRSANAYQSYICVLAPESCISNPKFFVLFFFILTLDPMHSTQRKNKKNIKTYATGPDPTVSGSEPSGPNSKIQGTGTGTSNSRFRANFRHGLPASVSRSGSEFEPDFCGCLQFRL